MSKARLEPRAPAPIPPWPGRLVRGDRVRMVAVALAALVVMTTGAAAVVLRPPESYLPKVPQRSLLTAVVENRVLRAQIVGRGNVRAESSLPVHCAPAGEGVAQSQLRVFTKAVATGHVKEGDVLAAINGRPVLVLAGGVSAFRDILPGVVGPDVEQVQAALKRLGYSTGADPMGTFGAATQASVSKLFADRGFRAKGPTREESAQLSAARSSAAQAEAAIVQARAALDAAKTALQADRLSAEIALKEAKARVAQAVTPTDRELAELGVRAAKLRMDEVNRKTLSAERDTLALTQRTAEQAKEQLAHVQATVGTSVPYCEVVFVPLLPATARVPAADGAPDPAEGSVDRAPWVTLTSQNLVLTMELTASDRDLVQSGASASVRFDDESTELTASVADVATLSTGKIAARILPAAPFASERLDANVRVAIDVQATAGPALVVPVAAVTGSASGDAKLTVVDEVGKEREIDVRAGLVAEGFVQVTPVIAEELKEGDRVRVGA